MKKKVKKKQRDNALKITKESLGLYILNICMDNMWWGLKKKKDHSEQKLKNLNMWCK